ALWQDGRSKSQGVSRFLVAKCRKSQQRRLPGCRPSWQHTGSRKERRMAAQTLPLIEVNRLQPGMHVVLDLGWRRHPFPLNSFTLRSDEQIATLRSLGLEKVRYCPERSTVAPLPPSAAPARSAAPAAPPVVAPAPAPATGIIVEQLDDP